MPWKDGKALRQLHGINKYFYAWDPEHVPGADPVNGTPQDCMHLFPDGLLRIEGAWMLYCMCKVMGKGLLAEVNRAIRLYRKWPADVRIPSLHSNVLEGQRGGKPKREAVLRLTGSQMMWFALHSRQLIYPLLSEKARTHPAWLCWCKLVEVWTLVVQHEISRADIERLDDLIVEHSTLFDQVPQYATLKRPKHHLLTHLPNDLWAYGPARGYWCFGFERFNQVIKVGANRSAWRDEATTVMQYWSLRSAREMDSQCAYGVNQGGSK
jgi:hypothetical protein